MPVPIPEDVGRRSLASSLSTAFMAVKLSTTPERSALMSRVRQRHTDLELIVRRALTNLGIRYRVNVEGIPGRPDIASKARRKAIFVNGCFWHNHSCPRGKIPTRNRDFWERKLAQNRERDDRKVRNLQDLGYDVLSIWECELEDQERLTKDLATFWFKV